MKVKNLLIIAITAGVFIWGFAIFLGLKTERVKADSSFGLSLISSQNNELTIIQENSILPISNTAISSKPVPRLKMVITGYSSTTWETDDDPYITASGTDVKEGTVANNLLAFGTKIRIPELYGDKVFVVQDRMNWRKSNYHLDIWFPDYSQALNFGTKITYIEILES